MKKNTRSARRTKSKRRAPTKKCMTFAEIRKMRKLAYTAETAKTHTKQKRALSAIRRLMKNKRVGCRL